jgi:5-methylcytosine-specific restriction endonuclease McrA
VSETLETFERDGVLYYQPPPMKNGRKSRTRPAARLIAQMNGEKRYFSGLPCKRGHIDWRLTDSGSCMECNRQAAVDFYWEDPEAGRQRTTDYRLANPEKVRETQYNYYWRNPELARARSRDDYARNGERRRFTARSWKKRNKPHVKFYTHNWRMDHAEHISDYNQTYRTENAAAISITQRIYRNSHKAEHACNERNRRARKVNAEGSHNKDDVIRILAMQKHRCAYCRVVLHSKFHVDHIFPLALGGSDWPSNLQCLCVKCNLRKNKLKPEVFARRIGLLI